MACDRQVACNDKISHEPIVNRYRSIPGSLTEIVISIKENCAYSVRTYPDVPPSPGVEYTGDAYRDDFAIVLYTFDGGSVTLKNHGSGVYVREGMDLQDAISRGWCFAEVDENNEFCNWPSVERFLAENKNCEDKE